MYNTFVTPHRYLFTCFTLWVKVENRLRIYKSYEARRRVKQGFSISFRAVLFIIFIMRDLGGWMAAVNISLLPVMESCSPGFAGSRWIWSKEIVSFSDDDISDEISKHGCRIYFTLKMLRKKLLAWKNHQADNSLHSKLKLMIMKGKHSNFRNSLSLFVDVAWRQATLVLQFFCGDRYVLKFANLSISQCRDVEL